MDPHMDIVDTPSLSDTATTDGREGPSSSSSRKRGPSRGKNLSNRRHKIVLRTNEFGEPNEDCPEHAEFKTAVGVLARSHIPIIRKDYRDVPKRHTKKIIGILSESYEFKGSGETWINHLQQLMNAAWRNHKHELYKRHIKGKDLAEGTDKHTPFGVPTEDWKEFVVQRTSNEFIAASIRNTTNRSKQKAPSTTGRRSLAVIRHKMAQERNLTSDFEVGRAEVYIKAHTRKDGVVQCPEVVEKINKAISDNPDSRQTSMDDALTQSIGKDSRGYMRGLGGSIGRILIKKGAPMLKKIQSLQGENVTLTQKLEHVSDDVNQLKDSMKDLKKFVAERMSESNPTHPTTPRSSHVSASENYCIGKHCVVRGGFPLEDVAHGEVMSVDPVEIVHGSPMGENNYKVVITQINDANARLFKPDPYHVTIGEVGVGGFIVWGKEYLRF